jgi:hypothetical protein
MSNTLNQLNNANYRTVKVTNDPVENGVRLQLTVSEAGISTPGDMALSADNRVVVLIPPGSYDLQGRQLNLNTAYVDLAGTTDNRDAQYIYSDITTPNEGVMRVGVGGSKYSNLKIENTATTGVLSNSSADPCAFFPTTSFLSATEFTNCEFKGNSTNSWSMRVGFTIASTFKNCVSGDRGFGGEASGGGTATGTFIDCVAGDTSFGGGSSGSTGTFINCTGGDDCFSSGTGTASGVYKNCVAGDNSFGGNSGTASGTFTDCIGGAVSFGGAGGTASGIFKRCSAGNFCFGGVFFGSPGVASGEFENCNCLSGGFGAGGSSTGTFINCYAVAGSFGDKAGVYINCSGF